MKATAQVDDIILQATSCFEHMPIVVLVMVLQPPWQ